MNETGPLVPAMVPTVTETVPIVAVGEMVSVAVIFVALTTDTFEAVTPAELVLTVAPLTKLPPVNVTLTEPPCAPMAGDIELIVGTVLIAPGWNKSERSVAVQAALRQGVTPKTSWVVRRSEE